MAHAKKRSPLKGRKHTKRRGTVKRHRRMVAGVNPPVVSGIRRKKSRRKVGALTGNDFLDALAGIAGGLVISVVYDKFVPINNAKAKAGLEAALGLAATYFGAKKKNMLLLGVGMGVAGNGLKNAAHEFGIIKGMQDFMGKVGAPGEDAMLIEMNGTGSQDMMGTLDIMGNSMPPTIS